MFLFSIFFLFSTASTYSAEQYINENSTLTTTPVKSVIFYQNEAEILTEHERLAEIELSKFINSKSNSINGEITPFNDPSDYNITYGTPVTRTASGYPGNQDSNGYRFNTGGGFYWSEGGGPTVSLGISFPSPYDFVSISVPLGNYGSSGYFVTVPNTIDRFKLYVEQYFSIQPYNIYKRTYDVNTHSYYWKLVSKNHTKTRLGFDAYARKVFNCELCSQTSIIQK